MANLSHEGRSELKNDAVPAACSGAAGSRNQVPWPWCLGRPQSVRSPSLFHTHKTTPLHHTHHPARSYMVLWRQRVTQNAVIAMVDVLHNCALDRPMPQRWCKSLPLQLVPNRWWTSLADSAHSQGRWWARPSLDTHTPVVFEGLLFLAPAGNTYLLHSCFLIILICAQVFAASLETGRLGLGHLLPGCHPQTCRARPACVKVVAPP